MNRHALFCVLTMLTLASWAQAQNDRTGQNSPFATRGGSSRSEPDPMEALTALEKSIQAIDEPGLKEPPKRDFKVEQGPLTKTKLRKVDPKFIANKFVANFRLAKRSQVDLSSSDPRHVEQGPKSAITDVQRLMAGRGAVNTLRKAMLLNGVDLMRSGGFTSIVHGDQELSHTINAFDASLQTLQSEGLA